MPEVPGVAAYFLVWGFCPAQNELAPMSWDRAKEVDQYMLKSIRIVKEDVPCATSSTIPTISIRSVHFFPSLGYSESTPQSITFGP